MNEVWKEYKNKNTKTEIQKQKYKNRNTKTWNDRGIEDKSTEQKLELVSTQNYNGIVDLVYIKKSEFHGCVMVPILHSVQNVYNKDHGKNL